MTTQFLVINANEDSMLLPYSERFKLFNVDTDAIKHAKSIGFKSFYGELEINRKAGMATIYRCGPIDVSVLAIESQ